MRLVSNAEEYLHDPFCWGGDLKSRKGKLILVERDQSAIIYIISSTCKIRGAVGENSIIDHLSFVRIDGDDNVIREAFGISQNIRVVPNFIIPRTLPDLQSPVFDAEFVVDPQDSNEFQFFELNYLRVDEKSRTSFSNFLDNSPH